MDKKLYPLIFLPIGCKKPWGGDALVKKLGKSFTEIGEDGTEVQIDPNEKIGESWELADMGEHDSVITNGFLAGNTIGDLMETYMERLVGDKVFDTYGTQFPILMKFLDIQDKLSIQVHPDDETAAERYDSLGKKEMWYVIDAQPNAKVYLGFKQDVTAQEFYTRCKNGTADVLLNVVNPKKGDIIHINPGTVHAADGGVLICEIQESSDITFRLYDWGRELNPATARPTHLEEAIDLIDFNKVKDDVLTHATGAPRQNIAKEDQFTINDIILNEPAKLAFSQLDQFLIYSCLDGEVSLQMPDEQGVTKDYRLHKGEVMLVPAECPDFVLSPIVKGSHILEITVDVPEARDTYTGQMEQNPSE